MVKIMIVDDSKVILDSLEHTLVEAGHKVVRSLDGPGGVELAAANDLDLIITDFNMPNMNGLDMICEIRKIKNHKNTEVFVLTTETSESLKRKALQIGVSAWIVKPFNPERILQGVSKFVERRGI